MAVKQWYVLHTRSRQEKAVADHLAARNVEYFLPLARQVRFYGKRKAAVDLPIFPNYVFLCGEIEDAYNADRNGRLVNILSVADQERLVWELGNVRKAIKAQMTLDTCPHLHEGMCVEVRSGPMGGLQGVVDKRCRQLNRLVLQVDMLGRAVSVEVDASLLDPID